ncbi:MAG: riboflavin synthase [Deltaproteobacteria bacterium]|nr:riboflavin synthase [Deltaproteobacteria bacterium]
MFTGLVEGTGIVKAIRGVRHEKTLAIAPLFPMNHIRLGESISVDGVCLTVTDLRDETFSMDVSGETLSRSTLGLLKQGDEVNLERALRFADRLGGHLVSGHVDGIGKIIKKTPQQRSWFMRIGLDQHLSRYTLEKGSIAVDGISLTINRCGENYFEVNIIPQTGVETTLIRKKVGMSVNIETDLIGKYIEKFLSAEKRPRPEGELSGINRDMLIRQGFGD